MGFSVLTIIIFLKEPALFNKRAFKL